MKSMGSDVKNKPPGHYRSAIAKYKILNHLSDGRSHGQREIRRRTGLSPATVNKYLKRFAEQGKVNVVIVEKWRRYRITQQGWDDLKFLRDDIIRERETYRTSSMVVDITVIPTVSAEDLMEIPIKVQIVASEGTPDPLSRSTRDQIKEILTTDPLPEAIPKLHNLLRASVMVQSGSPICSTTPQESEREE